MRPLDIQSGEHPASGWYVLATHPHREDYAIQNLERQNFRAYCPRIVTRVKRGRRVYDTPLPLFPSYVFVEQIPVLGRWKILLSTYGVRSIIRAGQVPSLIDAAFVAELKAREVDGILRQPENPYRVGQAISIRGGAFDGLVGTILEMRASERIVVLMNILNQQTKVVLTADALSPV